MHDNDASTDPRTTIIEGAALPVARLLTLAAGLALEINTGMVLSRRGSALGIARAMDVTRDGGDTWTPVTTAARRPKALADVVALLREAMPEGWQPAPTVQRALLKGTCKCGKPENDKKAHPGHPYATGHQGHTFEQAEPQP